MSDQLTYSIGLQVCRHHKLDHILNSLKIMMSQENFNVPFHIVVDRKSLEVEAILNQYRLNYVFTNGIGNWTSKNVLLNIFMGDGTDYIVLFEDDIHFHELSCLSQIKIAYEAAKQFLGYYKLNADVHYKTYVKDFKGKTIIKETPFSMFKTINTSALLLIDRKTIEKIGYFYNSYYENGFYDYRDRMKTSGLVDNLLVPDNLARCVSVDDSVPSTISRDDRQIYRQQILPPAINSWRPYEDKPAFVIK